MCEGKRAGRIAAADRSWLWRGGGGWPAIGGAGLRLPEREGGREGGRWEEEGREIEGRRREEGGPGEAGL